MRTGVVRVEDSEAAERARCTIPADSWQMHTEVKGKSCKIGVKFSLVRC
jgi:hypothetical protein